MRCWEFKPVFGTDEEIGLINAVEEAFPHSGKILCTCYLHLNDEQKLIDYTVDKKDRDMILKSIFWRSGLLTADDVICFEANSEEISKKIHGFYNHLSWVFWKLFEKNVQQLWEISLTAISINHGLKRQWITKPCAKRQQSVYFKWWQEDSKKLVKEIEKSTKKHDLSKKQTPV